MSEQQNPDTNSPPETKIHKNKIKPSFKGCLMITSKYRYMYLWYTLVYVYEFMFPAWNSEEQNNH